MASWSYYVIDPEGNTLAGPFDVESVALDWLAQSDSEDAIIITTGACDVE